MHRQAVEAAPAELAALGQALREARQEAQRQREENRRIRSLNVQLLASMRQGLVVLGPNLEILSFNPAFCKLFGVEAQGLEGKPLPQVASLDGVSGLVARVLASATPLPKQEAIYHHPTDGRRWLVLSASHLAPPALAAGMKGGAVLLTLEDVTEWKQSQEQLKETSRLISVGEIVAGVAHELNNPLTSVLGFAQFLLAQEPPAPNREELELIASEAQRAAKVVHNLLGFVRKRKAEKGLLEVSPVVERVLTLKAYDLRVNNIRVETSLESDLPKVLADEHQLEQVFLNLVTNAEQAMAEAHRGGRLHVQGKRNRHTVCLRFVDDGPGIPPANLKAIFEPFFTTKEKGTGLGLSICKSLVQEQRGRIWAESQEGKGATFYVELPVPESPPPD